MLLLLLLINVMIFINEVKCIPELNADSKSLEEQPATLAPQLTTTTTFTTKTRTKTRVKMFTVNGVDSNKLSWTEAYLFCRSIDSQLASVENYDEYLLLKTVLRKLPHGLTRNKRFWLGGGRDSSYDWVWTDTGKQINFAPWANNQPNYQGTCLELSSGDAAPVHVHLKSTLNLNPFHGGPQLYSQPCDKNNNFICHSFTTVQKSV